MTERDIIELAAILVNEHGPEALEIAERRRANFAPMPNSSGYRLWTRIAAATAHLLNAGQEHETV
jgi:hypothetical protein